MFYKSIVYKCCNKKIGQRTGTGNITKEEAELVNVDMRRCLTSLEIKGIQINAEMRNHLFTFQLANIPLKARRNGQFCALPMDNRNIKSYIFGRQFRNP